MSTRRATCSLDGLPAVAAGNALVRGEGRGWVSGVGAQTVLAQARFGEFDDVFVAVFEGSRAEFIEGGSVRLDRLPSGGVLGAMIAGEGEQQCRMGLP
jgi:hypothetical protein